MPGLNQTGPTGQGPLTGRRMGNCGNKGATPKNQTNDESVTSNNPSVENPAGRGLGRGRRMGGRGRGIGQQNRFRGGI